MNRDELKRAIREEVSANKSFWERFAAIDSETGARSTPPGITAAYPPAEVGTLAKYFYRVESDGQTVMVGFQTYDEMIGYIGKADIERSDEPAPFSTATLDHESRKSEQAEKDEYRAAVGEACFKEFCDKLIPGTATFKADEQIYYKQICHCGKEVDVIGGTTCSEFPLCMR